MTPNRSDSPHALDTALVQNDQRISDIQNIDKQAAGEQGFDTGRLKGLIEAVDRDITAARYDGARIILGRRGKIVLNATCGFNHRESGRRLAPDDVFSIMSLTKAWTSVAVLRLIERGDLALTTRVAEVIPEFGANGKSRISIVQLLTHTSGMPLGLPPVPIEKMGDLAANFRAICGMQPQSTPGQVVSYSASIGYTILGELIRRFDPQGRPFRRILNEDLLTPLRMTSSAVGSRKDLEGRRVPIVIRDDAPNVFGGALLVRMNELLTEDADIPGGGAWSSGQDMFRFAEMLRKGGALDGARILSPAMVKLATSIHTGTHSNNLMVMMREANLIEESPANLGLGFSIRGAGIHMSQFGTLASPATFGALGIGSMLFWVDPIRELTFVALTAGLMGQFNNYTRFQRLSDLAIASLIDL